MRYISYISVIVFKCLLLTACGSDVSNTSATFTSSYVGSVGDGPIVGATITIKDKHGVELGSGVSDELANYNISVVAERDSYPLIIEVAGGVDLVTNAPPTFLLRSVVFSPENNIVNVNPFSTLIVATAEAMGGLTLDNLISSTDIVLGELNFGFDRSLMVDPVYMEVTEQRVASIIKSSEQLGELIRRTRASMSENGSVINNDSVISVLSFDLVDGVIDGKGAAGVSGELSLRAKLIAGQIILEALPNQLRVNNVVATAALDASIAVIMPDASPIPMTDQVAGTAEMIAQLETAINISQSIAPSFTLSELMSVSSYLVGILPSDAINLLPDGAQAALNDGLNAIALLSAGKIAELNLPIKEEANHPPVIEGVAPISVKEGVAYFFEPDSNDVDGDPLIYSIRNKPLWAEFSVVTGILSGVPGFDHSGRFDEISISVTDGKEVVVLDSFSIAVENVNRRPIIDGAPLTEVLALTPYEFVPVAMDKDGDMLTFFIVNKPDWLDFNSDSGRLSGVPDNSHVGLYPEVVVQVSDGKETIAFPSFSIAVGLNNSAPIISGLPDGVVTEGAVYNFIPGANDPDGHSLFFSIVNPPAWVHFDSNSGQLSGVPGFSDGGVYTNIKIEVSDGYVTSSLPQFSITVENLNRAPVIGGEPVTTVGEGEVYSFSPMATDADGDELVFSALNLPAWMTMNSGTGTLSGVPGYSSSQMYRDIILQVSDGVDTSSLAAFDVTVVNVNQPPTISGSPSLSVKENSIYSFTPVASDADGGDLTFTIQNMPVWATFNIMTGELSGVPDFTDSQVYHNITLRVSDGVDTVSLDSFDLDVVNVNRAPVINGVPVLVADEGAVYSFTPVATDDDNDTLTFSIVNQPLWASFNSITGELQGTPGSSDSGNYPDIIISVSDGDQQVSLSSFSIDVVTYTTPTVGSAVLNWIAPSARIDGSEFQLSEIRGYRIYYGMDSTSLTLLVDVNTPAVDSYIVNDLPEGTHYFAVTVYDVNGVESAMSVVRSKTI